MALEEILPILLGWGPPIGLGIFFAVLGIFFWVLLAQVTVTQVKQTLKRHKLIDVARRAKLRCSSHAKKTLF